MINRDSVYRIGTIGKAHGIKGEVSFLFDDDVFDRVDADYLLLETEGLLVPFYIDEYRFRRDDAVIVKLDGIDSADRAQQLTGCAVYFPRELAEQADEGASLHSLVGYYINNVGCVTAIDDSTANVLFEVERPDGSTALLPVALAQGIDAESRTIDMDVPKGLLEL